MATNKKRKLGKSYSKGFTVGELVDTLKELPRNRQVRYTLGGSIDFALVTYVDKTGPYGEPYVLLGKLSW